MLELLPCRAILCHVARGTSLCEDVACKSEAFRSRRWRMRPSSAHLLDKFHPAFQAFSILEWSNLSFLASHRRSRVCTLQLDRSLFVLCSRFGCKTPYSIRARSSFFQPCWLLFLLREGIEYGRMRLNNRAVFAGYEIQFSVINLGVRRPVRKA